MEFDDIAVMAFIGIVVMAMTLIEVGVFYLVTESVALAMLLSGACVLAALLIMAVAQTRRWIKAQTK